ncbi:HAD-IC family P-type ATPase [Patescibacteria group bacterium]|nr:HAD-IC family P-type ATPase [Patescibacteria group bacterium]
MEKHIWHNLEVNNVMDVLHSSKSGLNQEEIKKRQKKYGKNILPKKPPLSKLKILLSQLKSPLVYILILAALISLILSHYVDLVVILIAVLINTLVGYLQENKANNSINKLRQLVKQFSKVIYDDQETQINAENLVPGDIILLEPGDKVPADARLIECDNLQVIEAALTGESVPSEKTITIVDKGTTLADRENMIYMGTVVEAGKAMAIVCEIGLDTEIGKITKLIRETPEEPTPLQVAMSTFSRTLTLIIAALSIFILVLGLLKGQPFFADATHPQGGMLATVVALAVASIPEGLVVAVTVVLTIGMQTILRHNGLVRRLVAAETLGSTSVICTDKTGTLTEGKMQVIQIATLDKQFNISEIAKKGQLKTTKEYEMILQISTLCNDAFIQNPEDKLEEPIVVGSPTEKALLLAAAQAGYNQKELEDEFTRLDEIPFDGDKKLMVTLNRSTDKNNIIYVKGAPEKLLERSNNILIQGKKQALTKTTQEKLRSDYETLTKKGLRIISFAYKETNDKKLGSDVSNLIFLGFVAIQDPLRKEAKEMIRLIIKAKIHPVIVTGDHKLTAKTIAQELGLKIKEENILEGSELDNLTDKALSKRIRDIIIFARVEPKHKLRIIAAWQAKGEVVAMTGDGINDAPAIKAADIGIAFGSGTDVAKETADIILLDNNFKTIVAAVKQGRIVYENIKKVILYLLTDSFSEMVLITGSLVMGWPLPILPSQILWINLITDGFPGIAMTLEPGEKEVMEGAPRKKDAKILDKEMKILIFAIGIITDFILLALFYWLLQGLHDISYVRTIIFAALGIDSLLYVFSVRSLRHSIFTKNPFSNKYLIWAVAAGFILQLLAIYEPHLQNIFQTQNLTWEWYLIGLLAVIKIIAIELTKQFFIINKKLKFKKIHV